MQHWYYALVLCGSLCCLGAVDHRFRLALFVDAVRTLISLLCGLLFFVVWDVLGTNLGIFRVGASTFISGIRLAPQFPLEELLFLLVLTYTALLLWRGAGKIWPRT